MHGLINCGLQSFAEEIFGTETWLDVCTAAALPFDRFETMLIYEDHITEAVVGALARQTNHTKEDLLEDFGTFLVSEHAPPSVLKLLRFGGNDFREFLHSLEGVYDRLKFALPELEMPRMRLEQNGKNDFGLFFQSTIDGYGEVFLGLLRAMADHYGVLATVEVQKETQNQSFFYRYRIKMFDDDWQGPTGKM